VKLHACDAAHPERCETVVMLQASELAFNCGASAVEVAVTLGVSLDARVEPGSSEPITPDA
jgi:hypothetical protein